MRIIAGSLKGRTIPTDHLSGVRPTTDRARETIFNILQNSLPFEDISVLDICAGSGAFGFEAISRGAAHCLFLEKDRNNAARIQETARQFTLEQCTEMMTGDALRLLPTLEERAFDLIFCDPPYALKLINPIMSLIDRFHLLKKKGIFVAEHEIYETVLLPEGWGLRTERTFGQSRVEFFEQHIPEAS